MASASLDQFLSTIGGIAAGSLQGQEQARQEHLAQTAQQQNQLIQLIPHLQAQAEAARQAQLAPYSVLAPHLGQMTPDAQAQFLSQYSTAAGQAPAGPNYGQIAGSFDPNSPTGSLLRSMGGPGQAPPQIYYGTPPVSHAPAPNAAPAPNMTPGMTPGANVASGTPPPPPPAPGAPVPNGPGAAGPGATGTATPHRPIVTTPFGQFEMGPDKKQIDLVRAEVARIAPRFGGKDLPPQSRSDAVAAIKLINQQLDAGDLEGARHTVAQLQSMEADIPRQEDRGAAGRGTALPRLYNSIANQFKAKGMTPSGAYSAIHQMRGMEQEATTLAQEHPELGVAGMDALSGFEPQIDEMEGQRTEADTLRRKKDRTPDETAHLQELDKAWQATAQDIHDKLRYDVPPERKGAALSQVRGYLAMLAPEQRTAENAAKFLESVGMGDVAQMVRDNGLNFGGAEAEKQTISLMKGLSGVMRPGTPDAVRKAFTDQIAAQSTLTGHPITLDPRTLVRPAGADIKGTHAYDQAVLEIAKLKQQNKLDADPNLGKWAQADLNMQIKHATLDAKTGKIDPTLLRSVAVHRMSAGQHEVDQAYSVYNKWRGQHQYLPGFDPEYYLKQTPDWQAKHPLDTTAAEGVKLYSTWRDKVNTQSTLLDTISKGQQRQQGSGQTAGGGTAAAGPALQQQRQTYRNGLLKSGATEHEANALMKWKFGASP